ncbi:MAG: hypothetical protein ABII88_01150 [Candidatus Omnitrophota bacterium]
MYDKIVKHIYYPLMQKIKGQKVISYAQKLEKSQWNTADVLEKEQWDNLKRLIDSAGKNVPYYKRIFKEEGIDTKNIKNYSDFRRIPCLEKDTVQQNFKELINPDYKEGFYRTKTSGSTGRVLELLHSIEVTSWIFAGQKRAQKWFDVEVGDKALFIWGRPLDSRFQELAGYIKTRLKNIILISAFELTEANLKKQWQKIKHFKPKYIYGYASSIFKLAEYVQKTDKQAEFSSKAVFTTAETLFNYQREVIEAVFDCPVAQEYGCAEVGAFAYECPQKNMHIYAENVFVEVLKNGQPAAAGETGEIVITSLNNYCMPFIRYRVGDMGSYLDKECACGRKLPLLDLKVAKVTDMVVTAGGEVFSSELFDYINLELKKKQITGIGQFRVTQENQEAFAVEIVKQEPFSEQAIDFFRKKMMEFFGNNIKIEFIFKKEIPRDKTGKMRYFISKLK